MTRISIVTINTAKGDFDYSSRLPWLSHSLSELQPDIVFLQESLATVDGELDTARTLASELQVGFVYEPARRKTRLVDGVERDSYSGLAILSRFPIAESVVLPLPADVADGERIALLARIQVGEKRLTLANVHLTHLGGAEFMRRTEIATLLDHPWFATPNDVCVLGGDLNTRISALSDLIGNHANFEIRDSWDCGADTGPRATVPVYLSPDDPRGQCLDYVLTVSSPGTPHPEFQESRVVLGDASDSGIYPSDHRGIATSLLLNGTTEQ